MNRKVTTMRACLLCSCALALASAAWANEVRQIFRPERHTPAHVNLRPDLQPIDDAAWVWMPGLDMRPSPLVNETRPKDLPNMPAHILKFRRAFEAVTGERLVLDVSADERFELCLDGAFIARGPHRGLPNRWYYQTYEIALTEGRHVLEAVVTRLGEHAPLAQLSLGGGFVVKASGSYDARLTTGKAAWEVAELANVRMTDKGLSGTFGVGSQCEVRGAAPRDEEPAAASWRPAEIVRPAVTSNGFWVAGLVTQGWRLFPTELPDQLHRTVAAGSFRAARHDADATGTFDAADAQAPEVAAFNDLLRKGTAVTVPAHATLRLAWDFGLYHCAYPELVVSSGRGARIRWAWTEALRDAQDVKHDRRAFAGLACRQAMTDTFLPDGRVHARFSAPWWRCGKWSQLVVETADEPLVVERLALEETRYPTPPLGSFACSDPGISDIVALCTRGMQMCMHEMFFDCPFFEQQMYPGDSRVQFLTAGFLNADDRLVRHAITIYDADRREDGMIAMNAPTRGTQESGTYTMCWPMMLRDYVRWRGNEAWLKARVPGLVQTMLSLGLFENADGFVEDLPGWCFMDWVARGDGPRGAWGADGVAPHGHAGEGVSAVNNLLYLAALRSAAEVCADTGHGPVAAGFAEKAERLSRAIVRRFWCEDRGLLADDDTRLNFSEHAQALAIVENVLDGARRARALEGLLKEDDLARCTVYFSHYLLEAFLACGRTDAFLSRLDLWRDYVRLGLTTPLEAPGNSRSDCHAWGSHPLYHLHHGVAGVAPAKPFFAAVRIAPQPGPLTWYRAKTPHPKGFVEQDLRFDGDRLSGTVALPMGVPGELVWRGKVLPLRPGVQKVEL